VSLALQNYLLTLLVYLGVNSIACWALNLQFGVSGVMNFAFILFQAIGAYVTAVLTLPPAQAAFAESYILGLELPWPLPLVGAMIAGRCSRSPWAPSRCGRAEGTSRRR